MGEAGASPPTATSAQPIVTQLSKRQTSSKKKRGFFRFSSAEAPGWPPEPRRPAVAHDGVVGALAAADCAVGSG